MDDSMIKKALKSLCYSNGWCYGVFWGFDLRNPLLLTFKEAYYEEQMGALINSILQQSHVLGGGLIGQAAFIKNHQWMHSDALQGIQNSLGSLDSFELSQEDTDFFWQFSMGIKTVAVISVEPRGVVQLGSTQKIAETEDFVGQVKELFKEIDDHHSDGSVNPSNMQLNSVLTGGILNCVDQNLRNGAYSEGFMVENHSLALPSTSNNEGANLIFPPASLTEYPIQFDSSYLFDCSYTGALNNHSDSSLLTSWHHLASGIQESFSDSIESESWRNFSLNAPVNFEEIFHSSNFSDIPQTSLENDFSQWFSPQLSCTPLLSKDLSHPNGLIQASTLSGKSNSVHKSENLPTSSLQSSVTDAFRSCNEVKDFEMDRMYDILGVEDGRKKIRGWNETLTDALNLNPDIRECVSEKHAGSTSNSLFSKLGIDHLLDGTASASSCSLTKSRFEYQLSAATKRRKIDNFSWIHNQGKFEGLPTFDDRMGSLEPVCCADRGNIEPNTEEYDKETHSCVDHSTDAGRSTTSRGQEELARTKKKKAKPGTRPRPKDRQMIQDRLAELRELIPNGEKMSIDRLLERTFRHLNFMQSLTKHADSLKQINRPKSLDIRNNHSSNGGGVTWACEVVDQNMVCPLIVEDLSTPGQMLIEMLCEEQGFFLEIVDIIRSFGLIILKGVMEVRETNKIWAHFMVEAEERRCVLRHEIFSSLIQLLQMTGQSAVSANDSAHGNAAMSSRMPTLNNFQPHISFPLNFSDAPEHKIRSAGP